jgi:hypothetical protein
VRAWAAVACGLAVAWTSPAAAGGALSASPWTTLRPLPEARDELGAASLGGLIYLAGGSGVDGDSATVWTYSIRTNSYTTRHPLPVAGWPTLLADGGHIYAFSTSGPDNRPLAYRYLAAEDRWRTLPPVVDPTTESFAAYGVGASGLIYAIDASGLYGATGPSEVYDPTTNAWSLLDDVATPDPRVDTRIGVFDTASQTFLPPPAALNSHPPEHPNGRMFWPDGRIYEFGGCETSTADSLCYSTPYASVYDPASQRWGISSQMPGWGADAEGVAAVAVNGRVFLFGGANAAGAGITTAAATYAPPTSLSAPPPTITQPPVPVPDITGMELSWTATDPLGVTGYDLQRRVNDGSWREAPLSYADCQCGWSYQPVRLIHTLHATVQYRVLASNGDGLTSDFVAGPTFRPPVRIPDSQSSLLYQGGWVVRSSGRATDGSLHRTSHAGASVDWTMRGLSVAFVTPIGRRLGTLDVYVDGVPEGVIDEHSATPFKHRVRWEFGFSERGTHTIRLVAEPSEGEPRVDVDGFKVIR